ncbi:BTB/POZ domain-containing protein 9-like [Uloborus diversus]|uniref:BTB/POZ domain-containing protein 9-like n=1 Tax=Uloborus diversus TaxID=327109 RepID=UPI002409F95C|nr:BTB/POZ domain-containing protein 9-like [Uloborus diversus]
MSSMLESAGGAGERLLLRENLSDLTIVCGNFRFPAHSLLLASQSAVLRSMLSDDFSEKNSRRIVLKDVKPETVELFLEYIYCGRVVFETWRDAYELLKVAHQYQVDPLVQRCGRFLEGVLSIANVCHLYQAAFVYSLWGLKEHCLRLIVDAGFILLESGAFKALGKDAVLEI